MITYVDSAIYSLKLTPTHAGFSRLLRRIALRSSCQQSRDMGVAHAWHGTNTLAE